MTLSCSHDYDGDSDGWWYDRPTDFSNLPGMRTRRRRCCSCQNMIDVAATVLEFRRFRGPVTDVEERICGDEVALAPWHMCSPCGEIFMNLDDIGYCLRIGEHPMREYLSEYHEITGFVPGRD